MAQVTEGVRKVLSVPWVYELAQRLLGAHAFRKSFVEQFFSPYNVDSVLDIGCGPAEILSYLPDVEYHGFDISSEYINQARDSFGDRGVFYDKELDEDDIDAMPEFDVVLMIGVLHHLDDEVAKNILSLARRALKDGGRLLTIDPVFAPGQNPIARYLVSKDRGQNVRVEEEYRRLVDGCFSQCSVEIKHRRWIPYTHCIMECS